MKRKDAVTRHYSQPDADMQQDMRTMREHYLTYEQKFRAFNPEFDADYGAEWLAAVVQAEQATTHAVRTGELKEHTGAVEAVMDQAQAALQTLFYYVGRAFPGNAGRLDQYGRRGYAAARDHQDKMRALLSTAHAAATRDHAALAAKGYAAAQLAALGQLGQQLTATNTTQEVKKRHQHRRHRPLHYPAKPGLRLRAGGERGGQGPVSGRRHHPGPVPARRRGRWRPGRAPRAESLTPRLQ